MKLEGRSARGQISEINALRERESLFETLWQVRRDGDIATDISETLIFRKRVIA